MTLSDSNSRTQLTNNMSCSLQPLASQLQSSCTALLSELQAAVTNADDTTFTTQRGLWSSGEEEHMFRRRPRFDSRQMFFFKSLQNSTKDSKRVWDSVKKFYRRIHICLRKLHDSDFQQRSSSHQERWSSAMGMGSSTR